MRNGAGLRARLWTIAGVVASLAACGGEDEAGEFDSIPVPDDVLEYLQLLPGVTVEERPTELPDYRFFVLTFEQPADHTDRDGASFPQHLTLLHRDRSAPVVLATSGYYGSEEPSRGEVGRLLAANVIRTEQRFFAPSRPDPADWSDLTIEQAAADHHRIVEALRRYYDESAWLSTGASKGGMTSIFHRRFYPDDVDAVIAYVAPLNHGRDDRRYIEFLDNVGDPACRDALRGLQRMALSRRDAMVAQLMSADPDLTYDRVGPAGAVEGAVTELPFAFWQYFGADLCSEMPGESATDEEIFGWLDIVGDVTYGSDQGIEYYAPYYYQAFTQLGYPATDTSPIADLLSASEIPMESYMPLGTSAGDFDDSAMEDIADWVASEGSQLMFVYGENDPWTAGKYELGDAADSHLFVVPGGNHGSSLEGLADSDRDEAFAILFRWTGVEPTPRRRAPGEPSDLTWLRPPTMRARR